MHAAYRSVHFANDMQHQLKLRWLAAQGICQYRYRLGTVAMQAVHMRTCRQCPWNTYQS